MSVVATLDHVVVNARDNLAGVAERWQRLGFVLTPLGRHTLGSTNHLAMFGTDYLELIGAPAARGDLPPMQWPPGLNALVFGTEDAARTYVAMQAAGVPADPPLDFSRPVDAAGGAHASFRTVNLEAGLVRSGRLYFCEHRSRALVWRDEWRVHPNGVIGVESVTIVADEPRVLGDLFAEMFGADAVATIPGGVRLACALTRIEVVERASFERDWGQTALPDVLSDGERAEVMAALTLRTTSRAQARAALRAGGIAAREAAGRVVVDAAEAAGVALAFVDG